MPANESLRTAETALPSAAITPAQPVVTTPDAADASTVVLAGRPDTPRASRNDAKVTDLISADKSAQGTASA